MLQHSTSAEDTAVQLHAGTRASTQVLRGATPESAPDLVACWLLETELRRAAARLPGLDQAGVSTVLDAVGLHVVPASLFREAGLLPGATLRSLDALHLAAAGRIGVDAVLTYDVRTAASARELGPAVVAPGLI